MADINHNVNTTSVSTQHSESVPKEIPKPSSIHINYNASQSASYISQRSSSLETFDSKSNASASPTNSSDGNGVEAACSADKSTLEDNESAGTGRKGAKNSAPEGGESASCSQKWLCNAEALPSTMLHPAHRSTPLKDAEYISTADKEGGDAQRLHLTGDDADDYLNDKEIFMPGDLQTPILGYETMESRSKFTVYKIQVRKTSSDSEGWFVFRRYSDFLHLNERLKFMFPGFRLALPPKRWFRDNFDTCFLEDRILGLQAFLDNITGHKDICNSRPVRGFLCTDEPPGPHDSLEESRALCETLEETVYNLRQELQEKDSEFTLLTEELTLYKSQVELLTKQLRVMNENLPSKGGEDDTLSSNSTHLPLTRGDSKTSLTASSSTAAAGRANIPVSTPACSKQSQEQDT